MDGSEMAPRTVVSSTVTLFSLAVDGTVTNGSRVSTGGVGVRSTTLSEIGCVSMNPRLGTSGTVNAELAYGASGESVADKLCGDLKLNNLENDNLVFRRGFLKKVGLWWWLWCCWPTNESPGAA